MPERKPVPFHEQEQLFRQQLGERLRKLRLERGLNQDELAHRAHLHRSHVGLLENARRDPQLTTLYRLARALEVTPAELLDLEREVGDDVAP